MEKSIEEAWAQAKVIFNHGTLQLTGAELRQARDQARPFVKLVAGRFIQALGDTVVPPKTRTQDVTLQVTGWRTELVLRYPRPTRIEKSTGRHYLDRFHVRLPIIEDANLELRFALGEGDTTRDAWDIIQWGLFSWGTRENIATKAKPVLRAMKERLPDLQLDSRESIAGVRGGAAQLARVMAYAEFGADVQASVEMVAQDLRRLLDAAQEYQDR